jgi:hypothetical protein
VEADCGRAVTDCDKFAKTERRKAIERDAEGCDLGSNIADNCLVLSHIDDMSLSCSRMSMLPFCAR